MSLSCKQMFRLTLLILAATGAHAIVVNIHITHHAGTTLCAWARTNVRVPAFACLAGGTEDKNVTAWSGTYDLISWEYQDAPKPSLSTVNWEDPNIVSVLIARDPMDRLLSGDGAYGPFGVVPRRLRAVRSEKQWWDFAQTYYANNYALHILADGDHSDRGLVRAKKLCNRFTYILDQACLDANLKVLANRLGWDKPLAEEDTPGGHTVHRDARTRIHNDEVWRFLVKQNKNDIALYKWLKTKSLVRCS